MEQGIITGTANQTVNDGYSHWMKDAKGWWLRFSDGTWPMAFGVFHPMAVAIVHGLIGCAGDDALFHIPVALLTVSRNLVGRIRGYFNTTFVRIIIIGAAAV